MKFKTIYDIKKVFKIEEDTIKMFVNNNIQYYYELIKSNKKAKRIINVPNFRLKSIQKWLLSNIFEKNFQFNSCVHGFVKEKSIVTNAKTHLYESKNWIYNLDINNFFDEIKSEMLYEKFSDLNWNTEVIESLVDICTYKNRLSQGFPTSPFLANLYMKNFDDVICKFAKEHNIRYTRYADDLTFSSEYKNNKECVTEEIKKIVEEQLLDIGLHLNNEKIRLQVGDRKKVTGINIYLNKLVISNRVQKKFDREIFFCNKFGVIQHLRNTDNYLTSNFKGYMYGKANFIKMINHDKGSSYINKLNKINWPT